VTLIASSVVMTHRLLRKTAVRTMRVRVVALRRTLSYATRKLSRGNIYFAVDLTIVEYNRTNGTLSASTSAQLAAIVPVVR